MLKKIIRRLTLIAAAAVMGIQCMAAGVSAAILNIEYYGYTSYFLYNGIYYSFDTDASNAAQKDGGSASYTTVISSKVPSRCVEKWLDPVSWRIFDTKYQAEVENGVLEAHLIFVDPNYKKEENTEKKDDTNTAKTPTNTSISPVVTKNRTEQTAAKDGEPYVMGKKTQAGWEKISQKAENMSGGSFTVVMNGCETIDKSVLKAIKDRNVTVVFSFSGGVKWSVNGKKVSECRDIEASVAYNTKTISSKLVQKVSDNAVTTTQLTVSDNEEDLGCTANITVKFDKKRKGLSAAVYSYDSENKSMKKVSAVKVSDDGSCTFSANKGGAYLIVLTKPEE